MSLVPSPPPRTADRFHRRLLVRLPLAVLFLLALVLAATTGHRALRPSGPAPSVRIGAGRAADEASDIVQALAALAPRHGLDIPIEVVETEGSLDNVARLSDGTLDLATVQADTVLPPDLRLVGVLFSDVYLVAVRASAGIDHLTALHGATIATAPEGSAQAASLQRLLAHYGLQDALTVRHMSDAEADRLLALEQLDAVFRVRSVHNPDLHALAAAVPLDIIAIDHAAALHATDPALRPAELPAGVLRGWPAVPRQNTPTVGVDRLLVARADVPADTVRALARLLFEHRQALVRQTPAAAGIQPPRREVSNPAPLHSGVEAWLDRAEPSYLEKNADYVSLLMSSVLLLGSWAWAGRAFVAGRMQRRADRHHHVLIEILRSVEAADTPEALAELRHRLLLILEEALDDVETEAISPAHFQGFALGWEAAHTALRDQERRLEAAGA